MDITQLLSKILKAKSIKDIINMSNYDFECKDIIKKIHPDVCRLPTANDAFVKFMELKNLFDNGFCFDDDSGKVIIKENIVIFDGDTDLLRKSIDNYNKIYNLAPPNFKKYLPNSFISNKMDLGDNYLSLKDVTLPEEHCRWILSRLLEFSGYMESIGYVHVGLNLDSFLVDPKTHGIKVISFYHVRPINSKLYSISAKYRLIYPPTIFDKKMSESKIDIELSKRTVCIILGDKSGVGVKLKKNVSTPFIEFLLKTNSNSIDAFIEWKKILSDNYESKFHHLNL